MSFVVYLCQTKHYMYFFHSKCNFNIDHFVFEKKIKTKIF